MSNVYIMVDEDGIYKIGKANNVEIRRAQVAVERKKKVFVYAWKPIENAIEFEFKLHKANKNFLQRGEREWYEFSKEYIHDIIQQYCFIVSADVVKKEVEAKVENEIKWLRYHYWISHYKEKIQNSEEVEKKELFQSAVKGFEYLLKFLERPESTIA